MLYKPEGRPSFELVTYVIDSDLNIISRVIEENGININSIFACGDIKQIYSAKVHKSVEIRRVAPADQQKRDPRRVYNRENNDDNIYYRGVIGEPRTGIDPDGIQSSDDNPLIAQQVQNLAYQWGEDLNEDFPVYRGYNN